ncbi:MAG: hypothetical protein ABL958_07320, partial [Bdellovibrionia bacterium]
KFGFAVKSNFGRGVKREFRAFSLFLAWINDDDNADHNSDVRYTFDQKEKRVSLQYVSSDMGASLGFFQGKDAPHVFSSNFVDAKETNANKLQLTYRTRHFSPIFRTISFNDAKWFARMLGQLTDAQITEALTTAGYDTCTADVYRVKLERRRDQLVAALGLDKENAVAGMNKVALFNEKNRPGTTFAYTPPAPCQKFYGPNGLAKTPTDGENSRDINFKTLGDADSPVRDLIGALTSHMFSMGAGQLGGLMQRYTWRGGAGFFDGAVVGPTTEVPAGETIATSPKQRYLDGQVMFMPARFVMLNPFRNQNEGKQYWIVGVSRVGIGANYLKSVPNANAMFKSLMKFTVDGTATFIKERVEIQPADASEVSSAVKHYYQVLNPKNIVAAFKGIHGKTKESLAAGSSMVVNSTYYVAGASIKNTVALLTSGPFASVGVNATVVHRTALMKEDDNTLLAVRSFGKGFEVKTEAGYKALFLTFPFFSFAGQKEGERQVVFSVPMAEATEKLVDGILDEEIEEIGKTGGDYIKYVLTDAKMNSTGTKFNLSLGGFTNWYRQNKRAIVTQVTTKGNSKVTETLDVRVKGTGKGSTLFDGRLIRDDYTVTGIAAKGQNVETVMTWNFKRQGTTRRDLLAYADRVFPVFPISLRPIDYSDRDLITNNLVTVDFEGYVVISKSGWAKILARSASGVPAKAALCNEWLKGVDFARLFPGNQQDRTLVSSVCTPQNIEAIFTPSSGDRERLYQNFANSGLEREKVSKLAWSLRLFLDRMEKATKVYAQPASASRDAKLRDAVVDLLYIKEYTEFIVKVLQGMMDEKASDYYQYGALESSSEGGIFLQASKIEVNENERGGLSEAEADGVRRPRSLLQNFAQKAFDALEDSHVFYDYFFIERIANRIPLREMYEITNQLPLD